jgi:hypothetical protein
VLIASAYFFRMYMLTHNESQVICLASFFYICSCEVLLHILVHSMNYLDLWAGDLVGAEGNFRFSKKTA